MSDVGSGSQDTPSGPVRLAGRATKALMRRPPCPPVESRAQTPPKSSVPDCQHDGFHSATSRYDRRAGVLRFMVVCDGCGAEVHEVAHIRYRPRFDSCRASSLAA
jgi:hypothetical protein